ncbi:hypothetical protein ACQCSX_14060 [Pseudarthrobacter sp. P1]|uniref:hypothetical protein n=1 Tax=Pseudarthrobacter sp. P1 TaxID=3418418 RepID=UPI003CF4F773
MSVDTQSKDLVLSIKGLTVDYPVHNGHFRAVDDVSFDVPRGHTVAIVGEPAAASPRWPVPSCAC